MKKILLIEDSKTIVKALASMLEANGFQPITAGDAESGIEKALLEHPDLVIMDTVLPGMNGFDACQTIKAKMGNNPPPIIVMTGDIGAINSAKARASGADDYVAKTSDFSLLFDAIRKLIK
jgi:DNA-binding response OmpR family regulator